MARAGRIVIAGVLPVGQRVLIEPFGPPVREISLLFAFLNPHTRARAAGLIASGQIVAGAPVSRGKKLSEVVAAIGDPARAREVEVMGRSGN